MGSCRTLQSRMRNCLSKQGSRHNLRARRRKRRSCGDKGSVVTFTNPTLQQMRDELRVGEEFLARYNRPGPRYTSYPTAPVWSDSFGPADLERVHEEADQAKSP